MVDYSLGKIYKIVCNTTGKCYIGSTCRPFLSQRLSKHMSHYQEYLNGKGCYVSSYEILENDNYEIILLENYPCKSKDELCDKERFYIENNSCVNLVIPFRTKEELAECKKKNDEEHKDELKGKRQEYYINNKI
jgi:hypothetical protein